MLSRGRQVTPEKVVVRSRELFKFWWVPTVSLERLKLEWPNFSTPVGYVMSRHVDDKSRLNGRGQGYGIAAPGHIVGIREAS